MACSRCLVNTVPFLFPCSSTSEQVLTRTPLPTSVAGRLTAPLVLISLPSRSQQPAQLQPCSATCWTRCTRLQSQGVLLASRFPLGYYRSHPPGYTGFQNNPPDSGKGWGWDCGGGLAGPSSVTLGVAALPSFPPSPGTHGHRWGSNAGAQGAGAGWRDSPPGWDTAAGDSEGCEFPQAAAE